jgi:hypothetical protein
MKMKFRLLLTLIGVCLVWGVPAAESDEVNEATGEIVSATPASPAPRALTCSLSFPMAVSRGTTPQWTINYPDSVGKPRTENVFFFWPSVVPNIFKELGLGQKQFLDAGAPVTTGSFEVIGVPLATNVQGTGFAFATVQSPQGPCAAFAVFQVGP